MDDFTSFKVNQLKLVGLNIQFTVIIGKDRLVFVKTGGQFADMRYIVGFFAPVAVLGFLLGIIGAVFTNAYLSLVFMVVGMLLGIWIGDFAAKYYVSPRKTPQLEIELNSSTADELMMRDKSNFMVPYSGIEKITLKKSSIGANGPISGLLFLDDTKYEIAPGQELQQIMTMLANVLPGKLEEGVGL